MAHEIPRKVSTLLRTARAWADNDGAEERSSLRRAIDALATFTVAGQNKDRFDGDTEIEGEHDDDFINMAKLDDATIVHFADLRGLYKIATDQLQEVTAERNQLRGRR